MIFLPNSKGAKEDKRLHILSLKPVQYLCIWQSSCLSQECQSFCAQQQGMLANIGEKKGKEKPFCFFSTILITYLCFGSQGRPNMP